jgi:RND family efflux transporter MFP subunit
LAKLFFVPVFVMLAGCEQSHADRAQQKPPPATVVVARPVEQSIVDFVEYTGRTEAAESVEIRSRVTGFLDKVCFKDGDEVEKGAPLYEIDDREYQAALTAAQGELLSAKAHQEKTTTDFNRMEKLKQKGAASAEEYDRADAAKKEADAAVESTDAKRIRAQLDVDFSKIGAPIAGKISRTYISEGNLISANVSLLTTLVSVEPMQVYFDVDERTILTLKKQVREGQLESRKEEEFPIMMGFAIDKDYPYTGVIDFIDNHVDPRTGTIRVRGTFQNPRPAKGDRLLDAGLFARVRVPLGRPKPAVLVAERAIGTDQGQKFLYVINEKNEVVFRPVRLGAKHEALRIVAEGLNAGERIIIDGLQRVRPGSVVDPKDGDMFSRPGGAPKSQATAPDKSEHADASATSQHSKSAE